MSEWWFNAMSATETIFMAGIASVLRENVHDLLQVTIGEIHNLQQNLCNVAKL